MARTTRRTGSRQAARSRKFIWARRNVNQIAAANGPTWLNLLDQFEAEYGAQLLGATVMRIRGRLLFEPAAAATAVCAAAVIVTSDEDIADGVDDGPFVEQHRDWMAYEPVILNDADPLLQNPMWEIDVKSSRRMEELGQGLGFVFDNRLAATAITVQGIVSIGLKLP